jgi:hypothetical protein
VRRILVKSSHQLKMQETENQKPAEMAHMVQGARRAAAVKKEQNKLHDLQPA